MKNRISRREMLRLTSQTVALGALAGSDCLAAKKRPIANPHGGVTGEPSGAATQPE